MKKYEERKRECPFIVVILQLSVVSSYVHRCVSGSHCVTNWRPVGSQGGEENKLFHYSTILSPLYPCKKCTV